jgi:hypothetical protein
MPILQTVEQRLLFRLTRFVAFCIVLFLTLGLLIGALVFMSDFLPNKQSHISFSTLHNELHPSQAGGEDSTPDATPQIPQQDNLNLPLVLQPLFSTAQNRTVLKNHMSTLDSDERDEYLENLAEVVTEAKKRGDDVTEIVNRYFEDKTPQIELAKLDRASRLEHQLYIVGGAVSIILLISFASLILVLLAIERNTRGSILDV